MESRVTWWMILALWLVPLTVSVVELYRRHRLGIDQSQLTIATTVGGVGFGLFVVAQLVDPQATLRWGLLAGSLVLLAWSTLRLWRMRDRRE